MFYYIIRHKPSGSYIPSGRGAATTKTLSPKKVPRLYKRIEDAKNSLNYYLQGEWGRHCNEYGEPSKELEVLPKKDRNRKDFEVLKVELKAVEDARN